MQCINNHGTQLDTCQWGWCDMPRLHFTKLSCKWKMHRGIEWMLALISGLWVKNLYQKSVVIINDLWDVKQTNPMIWIGLQMPADLRDLRSSVLLCSLQNSTFPLEHEARKSFKYLKEELINVLLGVIHEDVVFASETDTSEVVISATYDERGSFVAFFERSFSKSELHMISVKKEL